MHDFRDKLRLAVSMLRRSSGVGGKVRASKHVCRMGMRYLARHFPFMGRFVGASGSALNYEGGSDLDQPAGVYRYEMLAFKLEPIPVRIDATREQTVNFFLPTIDPHLIFGGYIAAFNLIERLLDEGRHVRIISCEPTVTNRSRLDRVAANNKLLSRVLPRCEIYFRNDRLKAIPFSERDDFMAYSWETMRHAHSVSKQVNGRKVIYLVQEYEPIFTPLDSVHFLAAETYELPHFALFNSELLRDFYKMRRIGVFSPAIKNPDEVHACFSHAITNLSPPSLERLQERKTRRVLFYARPEAHASRNLFEIGIMALNLAIEKGVFDERWTFTGIGAMALTGTLPLSCGRQLTMAKRMPLDEYTNYVASHDVGLCLMYAPHPSVPPFEMASAGLPTVTTTFENKPQEVLQAISSNLLAAKLTVPSIVESLQRAVEIADKPEQRLAGAGFDKVCEWKQSFNPELMARLPLSPMPPLSRASPRPQMIGAKR